MSTKLMAFRPATLLGLILAALLTLVPPAAIEAQNLIANPNFDEPASVMVWQNAATAGTVTFAAEDGAPLPGSLEIVSEAAAPSTLDRCDQALVSPIEFGPSGTYTLSGFVKLVGDSGISPPEMTLTLHSGLISEAPVCDGPESQSITFDLPAVSNEWTEFEVSIESPNFVIDYQIELTSSHTLTGPSTLRLDSLRLTTPDYIFSDGFDSGTSLYWSATVEP